ncbi:MAG: hypothetical protein ACD_74C00082G0005 [uncultured bacterium]|nr:MAG: hypothetical protein ACD_74C00082G0005 [uncultured bacterium]
MNVYIEKKNQGSHPVTLRGLQGDRVTGCHPRRVTPLILMLALGLLAGSALAAGGNLSTDHDNSSRTDSDQGKSVKRTEEHRKSEGSKTAATDSLGVDIRAQESVKMASQSQKGNSLDISIDLQAVFLEGLYRMEQTHPVLSSKKLLTNPRLPADFGLTAVIRPGWIDAIRAKGMREMAVSNAPVSSLGDEDALQQYKIDLAYYGAVIGQAYLYLSQDLSALDAGARKKDKTGAVTVNKLGYLDFQTLADAALAKANTSITDLRIKRLYDSIVADKTPCRFADSTSKIQCGGTMVIVGTQPELYANGVNVYGKAFAGYSGSYKLSSSWSYSQAVENLKSSGTFSRFAEDVSRYADELTSRGQGREAIETKKKAMSAVASGKRGLSLSGLLPGIH